MLRTVILFFLLQSTLSAALYTIEDLEVLQEQSSYLEYFEHALDIRPSARDKHWTEMTQSMSIGLIKQQIKLKNLKLKHFKLIEKISGWPALKQDEFFQVKRNQYAIEYFKQCLLLGGQSKCRQEIESYWTKSNKDPETAYQLALIQQGFLRNADVSFFLSSLLAHKDSDFYCHKPIVFQEIENQLFINLRSHLKIKEAKSRVNQLLHPKCWKKASSILKESFLSREDSGHHSLLLALMAKEELNVDEKKLYLIYYLLKGPIYGDLMNMAWSSIEELGQDFKARERVFKSLKSLDPLPGKMFGPLSANLQRPLLRHFNQHFPEYIDHYAKTCLSYLKGEKVFPTGNPTPYCKDLFKISKNKDFVSQTLQIRYSGIIKKELKQPKER